MESKEILKDTIVTNCLNGKRASTGFIEDSFAQSRVHTDALDIKVCAACAEEAMKIGLPVEVVQRSLTHEPNTSDKPCKGKRFPRFEAAHLSLGDNELMKSSF